MTPELFWLTLTMLLAATMWLPFIIGVNTTESGQQVTKDGRANIPGMAPWVQRANRAHLNLLEQAMPFAALVLLAHVLNVTSVVTVWAAIGFFWLRLAHAVFMITSGKQIPIRPIIFTFAWLCPVAVGIEILRLA